VSRRRGRTRRTAARHAPTRWCERVSRLPEPRPAGSSPPSSTPTGRRGSFRGARMRRCAVCRTRSRVAPGKARELAGDVAEPGWGPEHDQNPNEPSRVATPRSMPFICRTAATQDAAAIPSVTVRAAGVAAAFPRDMMPNRGGTTPPGLTTQPARQRRATRSGAPSSWRRHHASSRPWTATWGRGRCLPPRFPRRRRWPRATDSAEAFGMSRPRDISVSVGPVMTEWTKERRTDGEVTARACGLLVDLQPTDGQWIAAFCTVDDLSSPPGPWNPRTSGRSMSTKTRLHVGTV